MRSHVMATPSTPLRALRIGVLLRDNLVEEKLVRGPTAITIGQSLRCTLSLPVDGLPHEHVLFAVDQGRLLLRLTGAMTGRLAQGGAIQSELRDVTVPIERGARGRVQVGEATVLFQEVAAPPLSPRPQLPAAVRGSLTDRIDPRLAVIVAASLLAHLGIATWAWATDREHELDEPTALNDYQPTQYDVYSITVPDEPVAPTTDPSTGPSTDPSTEPGIARPVTPTQTSRPIVQRPPTAMPTPEDPDRWAQIMTGNTSGPNGQTEISKRIPGAALDKQIDAIRRSNGEVKVGRDSGSRDTDPHRLGTGPDGPRIGDVDQLTKGPTHEEKPVRITLLPPSVRPPPKDQGTLTVDMVLERINSSYMSGLQRCYRLDLAKDPTLSGNLAIAFTVDERGRTTESVVTGLTSSVDACVAQNMASWHFPSPKDKDGDPMEVPFKVVLVLKSS